MAEAGISAAKSISRQLVGIKLRRERVEAAARRRAERSRFSVIFLWSVARSQITVPLAEREGMVRREPLLLGSGVRAILVGSAEAPAAGPSSRITRARSPKELSCKTLPLAATAETEAQVEQHGVVPKEESAELAELAATVAAAQFMQRRNCWSRPRRSNLVQHVAGMVEMAAAAAVLIGQTVVVAAPGRRAVLVGMRKAEGSSWLVAH
jgi:hypothetical protein